MANTTTTAPSNMAQAVSSSGHTLRPSAGAFQPGMGTSSSTPITAPNQVTAHSGSQVSNVFHEDVLLAGAPTAPAAMRNLQAQRRIKTDDRLPRAMSQSNGYRFLDGNEQSAGADQLANNFIVKRSTSRQSRMPEDNSRFQKREYHESAKKYWQDEQITFKPSSASFTVGMLAFRYMAEREGTAEYNDAMPSGNDLFDHYKNGEWKAAQQPVSCRDSSCQCGATIRIWQEKFEVLATAHFIDKTGHERFFHPQYREANEEFKASIRREADLKSELATTRSERDEAQTRNHILEQRIAEMNKMAEKTEEQKKADEGRRKAIAEDFKKRVEDRQASAAEQAKNQNAGEQTAIPAQHEQTSLPSTTRNLPGEAVVHAMSV